jgi:hypothetical protein
MLGEPYVALKYFVNISIFLQLWNLFMLACITNFDFKELAIALFNYVKLKLKLILYIFCMCSYEP